MKKDLPMPLRMLYAANNCIGLSFWNTLDKYVTAHRDEWDNRCYVPAEYVRYLLDEHIKEYNLKENKVPFWTIAALAGWRRCKEIYSFDETFAELLMEDADMNVALPYSALAAMPFNCFYLDCRIDPYCGFFVFFEHDTAKDIVSLRIDGVDPTYPNQTSCISLNLLGDTIADGIRDSLEREKEAAMTAGFLNFNDPASAATYHYMKEVFYGIIPKAVQLILYLCAENAEVSENAVQKQYTQRGPQIKDQYREIRKWDVGMDAGVRIRQHYANKTTNGIKEKSGEDSAATSHASPSPHMRKAHWHNYWVGKRDSEERRLVLKWLPPTFVAGDGVAKVTTVNKVNEKK